MDWYRKAKVINVDTRDGYQTFRRCMTCGRFATSPLGDNSGDITWKLEHEMDADEKIDRALAIKHWEMGNTKSAIGVTDGYCPSCENDQMTEIKEHIERRKQERAQVS